MEPTLIDRFFREECNDYVRELLLEEIRTRSEGRRRFTFNVFNVLLDVDSGMVTVEDVLEPDADQSVPLSEFHARLLGYRPV
jgi:hypothetical protein